MSGSSKLIKKKVPLSSSLSPKIKRADEKRANDLVERYTTLTVKSVSNSYTSEEEEIWESGREALENVKASKAAEKSDSQAKSL